MKKIMYFATAFLIVLMMIIIMPPQTVEAATTSISKCKITLSKTSYDYSGKACKPSVTVKKDGKTLKKGTDYTVAYANNTYPGTATVTVSGKGKYSGSVKKTFKIKNALSVTLSKKTYTYSGKANKPAVTVKSGKTKLSAKYYSVTYKNHTKAGTASVTVMGKGKYKGKNAYVTFKIVAKTIAKATISLQKSEYTYTGSEVKPAVTVKDGKTTLKSGRDYTVQYSNHTNIGTATVSVTGKGNYKGTAKKTFTISAQKIEDSWITLSETSFTYTGEEIKPVVAVKNAGNTLAEGTDYSVTYSDHINAGTGSVSVTGKGTYAGNVKKAFTIVPKTIEAGWVTLSESSFTYTGQEIKPSVTVKDGTKTLEAGTDYMVVYSNHINAGTASVQVTGTGNYTGTVTAQYEIVNQVSVSISPVTLTLKSGERAHISIVNRPDSFGLDEFRSENTNVATVGWDGNTFEVIGNQPGATRIVIKMNGKEFYCDVEVTAAAGGGGNEGGEDIPASGNAIEDRTYRVGDYTYGLVDEEFKNLEGEEVWTSSDEGIAKIYDSTKYDNKFINFIGAGKVTISVSKNNVTKSTTVSVMPASDDLSCVTTGSSYESNRSSGTGFSYGQSADSVLGQTALETTSAHELNNPNGFDYCKIGDTYYCFVADVYNNRVLCYTSKISVVDALSGGSLVADESTADVNDRMANPGTPAFVLGQPDFTSSTPGYGKNQMNWPMSVAVEKCSDEKYRLYVADTDNHRVLVFEDIASLTRGAAADYVLDCLEKNDGTKRKIGWPWSVASIDVNGTQKFLVTSTEGSELGVFTSPLGGNWSDEIKPDLVYHFGDSATPRTITWTGKQLLIGDENIPRNGGNQSGFHVFNEFPTSQESTCFSFFGQVGYSEGAVINDKLYMVYAGGWNIFHKNEDGTYVEGENAVPDLELHSVRESNYRVNDGDDGYFLDAGGTQKVTYVKEDNTLVMVMLGRSAIYAWTNPSEKLTGLNTSAPDVYIGDVKYKEDLSHVASDVQMHNPNVVSDGKHLVVHNDLDGVLYVYKNIPTSSGAVADYKYTLYNAAMDVTLCTKDDTSFMALTGNSNNAIYIWDDYRFDGALPNRVLRNRIGGMNLPEQEAILQYFRYDGTYSYLVITERGSQVMYVYEGLVDENSRYLVRMEGLGQFPYGMVSSNDAYVAVTVARFDSGRMGMCLIDKSEVIKKATIENPLNINVNDKRDGVYEISRVHCGVTATEENDLEDNGVESEVCHYPDNKSEVNTCKANEVLIKNWTGQNGMNYLNHEYVGFSLIGGCLLTNDGKLILADTGHGRVIVWNSVDAAIADQRKDYQNLTEDNANVVILGNGANRYDKEDLNGHTKYDGHNGIKATYADTFRMPKTLAYDGSNLWIGEFKFSNRLLRYEMK